MSRLYSWGVAAGCVVWCLATSEAADLRPDDAKILGRKAALEALRFGVKGDKARRDAKLAVAIARDPNCQLARWHQGQMQHAEQWLTVTEMEAALATNERHQAYLKRRRALSGDPSGELRFARWCAGQQLKDLAEFHHRQVLRNPQASESVRNEARRKLGLELHRGVWLNESQISEIDDKLESLKRADKHWSSRVQRWAKSLQRASPKRVKFVRMQLAEIDDVAVIPILEQHLVTAGETAAQEVVKWLDRHPQQEATESLLKISLDVPWHDVKQHAVHALAKRPLHDFVPQLLGLLVPPIETRFTIRMSPLGSVLHRHEFYRSGQDGNELARADFHRWQIGFRDSPAPLTPRSRFVMRMRRRGGNGERVSPSERGLALADVRQRAEIMALEASVRSAMIEKDVAQTNQLVAQHNDRIFAVLDGTTNAMVLANPELWWEWWDDYTERFVPPKNTRFSYGFRSTYVAPAYDIGIVRMSCFAGGTLVRTDAGLRPIEEIRPGDRVLSQDVETGELAYKVVNARTERPDGPLLEILVGQTPILATKGHPFWVNGKGWRMTKRLSVGDLLHTLDGPQEVQAINAKDPQRAYNLVVNDFRSYFVGEAGALVHDNQPRQPTLALTPGLPRD